MPQQLLSRQPPPGYIPRHLWRKNKNLIHHETPLFATGRFIQRMLLRVKEVVENFGEISS